MAGLEAVIMVFTARKFYQDKYAFFCLEHEKLIVSRIMNTINLAGHSNHCLVFKD